MPRLECFKRHRAILVNDPRVLRLNVTMNRNCQTQIMLETISGEPIKAIVNRGFSFETREDAESQFAFAEWQAALWCVLALHPGAVINRPQKNGFMPRLDIFTVSELTRPFNPSILMFNGVLGHGWSEHQDFPNRRVNLHLWRNSAFVKCVEEHLEPGRFDELHLFREFDPRRTWSVMLAGNQIFDLSQSTGHLSSGRLKQIGPWLNMLQQHGQPWVSLTLEEDERQIRVLQVNMHPQQHEYRHLKDVVHVALRDYLLKDHARTATVSNTGNTNSLFGSLAT
jgi:hypothetical protein